MKQKYLVLILLEKKLLFGEHNFHTLLNVAKSSYFVNTSIANIRGYFGNTSCGEKHNRFGKNKHNDESVRKGAEKRSGENHWSKRMSTDKISKNRKGKNSDNCPKIEHHAKNRQIFNKEEIDKVIEMKDSGYKNIEIFDYFISLGYNIKYPYISKVYHKNKGEV